MVKRKPAKDKDVELILKLNTQLHGLHISDNEKTKTYATWLVIISWFVFGVGCILYSYLK